MRLNKISEDHSVRTKIKSQILANLCDNEKIVKILNYKPITPEDKKKYDPDDPWSLVGICIMPYLKKPETITTTQTLILLGVDVSHSYQSPMLFNATASIIVLADDSEMMNYTEVIGYTKADKLTDEIIKSVAKMNGTWIGDVIVSQIKEYSMSTTDRYAVEINLSLRDVNMAYELQN